MADAREVRERIRAKIRDAVRAFILRAYQALTSATPVATGYARAGWAASTGQPLLGAPDRPRDLETARAIAAALFSRNSAEAQALATRYDVGLGAAFLANNVRYIRPLNEGTSAQAAEMWVERAVLTALAATRADLARR